MQTGGNLGTSLTGSQQVTACKSAQLSAASTGLMILQGRIEILNVHAKGRRFAEGLSFDRIGRATAGCTGAELASIVNVAAITAVRAGRDAIIEEDMFDVSLSVAAVFCLYSFFFSFFLSSTQYMHSLVHAFAHSVACSSFAHPSIYPSVCPSIHLSIHPSICPSIHPFIHPFIRNPCQSGSARPARHALEQAAVSTTLVLC